MSQFATSQTYSHAAAVTTSDTADNYGTGLYVGGAGAVSLVMEDGSTVLFSGLPAGALLPVRFAKVRATGTTATLLTRLW